MNMTCDPENAETHDLIEIVESHWHCRKCAYVMDEFGENCNKVHPRCHKMSFDKAKYKCPECGQKTVTKVVFTECSCENLKCRYVDHMMHVRRSRHT